LLEHQIDAAREAGLDRLVFIGNPNNIAKIERILTGIQGIGFSLAIQKQPLGIADALTSAGRLLDGPLLIVNPNDVLSNLAYIRMMEQVSRAAASSYLLACRVDRYFPGGYLEVNSQNELQHIVEKPNPGDEPSDLVNVLVHYHSDPDLLLRHIERAQSTRDDIYECALGGMVKAGHKIKVIPYDGFWAPVKYPWHIFKAMEHFLDSSQAYVAPSARVSEKAIIEGKVILSDSVRVLENAVVRGPAYIGAHSIIGNNVLVRDYSHIGSNTVVGYGTEVKHSYIGDGCWFHSNYVGDSVIDDNCSLGAGAVLANLRLDEGAIRIEVGGTLVDTGYDKLGAIVGCGCRIGVNASLMPGIRVGPDSVVGPHVCLRKDLGAGKQALSEPRYRVRENTTGFDAEKRRQLRDRLS
jgi:UDP-N-acetylglucosamine diphosphorylase / glucose-1-phosphate thymidylyltransferase / UDP-N-acetylgalactosamine diphosphorylase / glucosamine-1-phosphate N-acetyltransferase / galactosamine-1-phosphate N-acetyltransferase